MATQCTLVEHAKALLDGADVEKMALSQVEAYVWSLGVWCGCADTSQKWQSLKDTNSGNCICYTNFFN